MMLKRLVTALIVANGIAGPAVAGEIEDVAAIERAIASMPAYCRVPAAMISDPSRLKRSASRVRNERILRIVVLGSASAQGAGASTPQNSWPAKLEVMLRDYFPTSTLRVIVKAKAYDTARKMYERMDEVIAERPHLVIWETGTAEAVRGLDIDEFIGTITDGVDRLASTRADLILVDPQFARRASMLINFQPYLAAIRHAEAMRDLIVFQRYDVMKFWAKNDQLVIDDLPRSMVADMADRVYDCIGRLLAVQVAYGMRRTP
jgi:hypothetical protein